jgi:hypothetical protein
MLPLYRLLSSDFEYRSELASHEEKLQVERDEKAKLEARLKQTEEMLLQKLTEKEVQLLKEQEQREAIEARLMHQRQRQQRQEEEEEQAAQKIGEARNMWKGYPVLTRKTVPLELQVEGKTQQKIYVSSGKVCISLKANAGVSWFQSPSYDITMQCVHANSICSLRSGDVLQVSVQVHRAKLKNCY